MTMLAFILLLAATVLAWWMNRRAAAAIRAGGTELHSLPGFHGLYAALTVLIPVLLFVLVWLSLQGAVINRLTLAAIPPEALAAKGAPSDLVLAEIRSVAAGRVFGDPEPWLQAAAERHARLHRLAGLALVIATALLSLALVVRARRRVAPAFRARQRVERIVGGILVSCALAAVFTTLGIIASLLFESLRFFEKVPLADFLFGLNWEPQIPMREDQVAAEGAFGWIPVLTGTLLITTIALLIAVPVGLLSALYLHEFAPRRVRAWVKPLLEILAGVPTVVYGFFAILVVAPALRDAGAALGLSVSPNTALAAGGVMGLMLVPFISSFADDALAAVPQRLKDGALALGATRAEAVTGVLFPAALPGIVGGVLLAVSRAIGETMIVVMAAGLIARLTFNPLDSVTTVTVQIVTLLIGDTAFDNPKTLAAFALGLMLFLVTLLINIVALGVVRRYRQAYD